MNVQLLTTDVRGAYLERILSDVATAEHFVLITAFATSDGVASLEPAMRTCLDAGGQGTIVLALDKPHFNAAGVFKKLAFLMEEFPNKLDVRVVQERAGLLHAKAVFAKRPDGGATLLVGSANLTERAFSHNHELGLWVDLTGQPEVSRKFQLFAQNLGGARHNAADLRKLAESLEGCVAPYVSTSAGAPRTPSPPPWPFDAGPPELVPVETFAGDWLRAGSIVGRGRRGLDVLVIRTPGEQLAHLGLINPKGRKSIAPAVDRIFSTGYGVRLLPAAEDKRLRQDVRRTQNILVKVTLNLPCFGLWMPKTHWDVFQEALAQVQADGITADEVRDAAERQRGEIDGDGLDRQVEVIVNDLGKSELLIPGRESDLRRELTAHFREQLDQRTPEVVARAVGFRTQRQSLTSDVDQIVIARSFFADLVHSTFGATYKTGDWPGSFHSFVGRELANRIRRRCVAKGENPSAALALQLLNGAQRWEDPAVSFATVTAEVNSLIGEADDFAAVKPEELLKASQKGGGGDDD